MEAATGGSRSDVIVMPPAVADFRPVDVRRRRSEGESSERAKPPSSSSSTPNDILAVRGPESRQDRCWWVSLGWTADVLDNAAQKRPQESRVMVANDAGPTGPDSLTTKHVTILLADGSTAPAAHLPKREVGDAVLDTVAELRGGAHR